ncbi:Hypothetical predicted protein, partial [Paramuricea clavata]
MDEKLKEILEEFWAWRLKEAPEFGTMVGEHSRDDLLDDMSLAAYDKRMKCAKDYIAKLEKIDVEKLDEDNKLNYELLHLELTTYINGMAFKCYLFPVNGLEGPQVDFGKTVSWMKNEVPADFEKILSRYNKYPKQADQIIELMKKGIETGYVNAKISMEKVPDMFTKIVETPVKESAFYEPFKEMPSPIEEKKRNSMQERAVKAINEKLYPAFTKISNYIKEKAWKSINNLLGKQTKQTVVNELNMGENILNNPQEIVEGFNEYFSNIGPDLASKLDMPKCNFETYVKKSTSEFAAFQPTTVNDIFNLLCGLSSNKATGIDKISCKIIKIAAPAIADSLTHIFNQASAINLSSFPDQWK